MKNRYSIQIIWSQEDKAWLAAVPELPGCVADGATPEAAIGALRSVAEQWVATAKEEGRPVPPPMDCDARDGMFEEFRANLQKHVREEVQAAVQRVLNEVAGKIPAMRSRDPADWWK